MKRNHEIIKLFRTEINTTDQMTMLHGLSVQYVRNENKNVKRVLFLKNKKNVSMHRTKIGNDAGTGR